MFTDIAGYTAMMQQNEADALSHRNRQRIVLDELIPAHNGRILQTFGDGTLAVFTSALDAVSCGIKIQLELQREPVCPLRIGIHTGDITYSENDVYGDGVNVASRIESVSVSGGVFISDKVYDEIKNQPSLPAVSVGVYEFKNVSRPVEVFALVSEGIKPPEGFTAEGKLKKRDEVIAVLPFANMSNDPDNEYFSDGISEEILNALTKVQGLQVVARTSSFSFKGKNEDMREIGRKLGASALIEGSVRKAGNKVRITAQLINTSDGTHYWSETYDRELNDIFAIQDEISLDIAHKLEKQFSNVHSPTHLVTSSTENIEAYEIYLKCNYRLSFAPTPELQLEIVKELEKAVELDPKFAKAYALLATTYVTMGVWRLVKPVDAYAKAREYSLKALSLDDSLAEAYLAYADYKKYNDWDWDETGRSIMKAMKLNPSNADVHADYGNYLRSVGKFEEALEHAKKAAALDPLSINFMNNLANHYVILKQYDKAEEVYLEALKINSNSTPTIYEYAFMFIAKGDYEGAMDFINRKIEEGHKWLGKKNIIHLLNCKSGNIENTKKVIYDILEKINEGKKEADLWELANLHTFTGEHDKAVEYLEKAAAEKIGAVVLIKFAVSFFDLSQNERFKKLCERIGLK